MQMIFQDTHFHLVEYFPQRNSKEKVAILWCTSLSQNNNNGEAE